MRRQDEDAGTAEEVAANRRRQAKNLRLAANRRRQAKNLRLLLEGLAETVAEEGVGNRKAGRETMSKANMEARIAAIEERRRSELEERVAKLETALSDALYELGRHAAEIKRLKGE